MHTITCYLDFASPYAWLAFAQLPHALEGMSYQVRYRPVLLGALLQHHGNPGPAGIAPKRAWTYRHATWLGQHLGVALQMPARHPFSPLPLLRLALQCSRVGDDGQADINRFVAETIFRHVWEGGHEALAPARLDALHASLAPQIRCELDAAKQRLRTNTDAAAALGVFGVPSFAAQERVYWGLDSLPMLRADLLGAADGGATLDASTWQALASVAQGLPG